MDDEIELFDAPMLNISKRLRFLNTMRSVLKRRSDARKQRVANMFKALPRVHAPTRRHSRESLLRSPGVSLY